MSSPPPLRTIGLGFVLRALNTARGFALGLVTVAVLVREMGSSGY
ncbi:MAG: hypothetical protein JWN67_4259, partial [Actinomycetia bacterium]|nr:hypothetical protein [Actinomycetes bacterium]